MSIPPSRAKEISGGLKNALDRGETLSEAKQSFINAGYTPQEIQSSAQMVKSTPIQTAPLPSSQIQPSPTKTSSTKTRIIIMSIIALVILTGALIAGLFWNKLF